MEKLSLGNALNTLDWFGISQPTPLDPAVLHELLTGGQAFRWVPVETVAPFICTYLGIVADQAWVIRMASDSSLQGASLNRIPPLPHQLDHYLGFEDAARIADSLPWRSDPILAEAKRRWGALSILRQPFEEVLLAFLLSSNRQIVQIRSNLENLAQHAGRPLDLQKGFAQQLQQHPSLKRALPTWQQISLLSEDELRALGVGYRARYLIGCAQFLKTHPNWIMEISAQDEDQAEKALQTLPGVGPKVAACIALFGLGHMSAFPVDTWIERILRKFYDLHPFSPLLLHKFARTHFGKGAGLAQQWLFAEARNSDHATRSAKKPLQLEKSPRLSN